MLNSNHLDQWFGLPVEEATAKTAFDFARKIYRFCYSYDDEADPTPLFEKFLTSPGVEKTVAIVCGLPGESDTSFDDFLDLLERHHGHLPALRGLFIGDILQEENEMSWINQGDVSRMLRCFPQLVELRARGQTDLAFSFVQHPNLTKLVIETGGMPKRVLHGIAASEFPALTHLELWLGTDDYGWDGKMEDILPLLNPALFPKLKHLALGNSDLQNEIAAAVADAPILNQLETLDLSLGVMTDAGAAPLLNSPRVRKLKKLNLHRNYLSASTAAAFKSLGIEVDVEGQEKPDTYDNEPHYYVAVGE